MAKNRKRALRRHHLARLKAKRRDYYGGYIRELPPQERRRHLGKLAHTAQLCSCWMCGNPRRYLKEVTVQELREETSAQAGLAELKKNGTAFILNPENHPEI